MRFPTLLAFLVCLPVAAVPALQNRNTDDTIRARAQEIHDRVLVLDSHVDINPQTFTAERNYTQELDIQVDLPKMERGGMDAAFFAVYTRQGDLSPGGYARAYSAAVEKFDAIHRLTAEYAPDEIELALTADDVRRIHASGGKAALIGVENAYPVGEDLGVILEFYERGARYMSLAHNGHSQLADSNTGEEDGIWLHDGLSELGTEALREINRLGIMADISHLSRDAMMEVLARSDAPVIASHSAMRGLVDHQRNLDDEQLIALRDNGGVVQVVAYPEFVKTHEPASAEREARDDEIRREFGLPVPSEPDYARRFEQAWSALPPDRRAAYLAARREMNDAFPGEPPADVGDFVDHIDYAVELIGIDHVGIASDFNNGEAVDGWFDAGETLNVTVELVRRGYTEEEIAMLWGLNLLRVMEEAQRIGREIQED